MGLVRKLGISLFVLTLLISLSLIICSIGLLCNFVPPYSAYRKILEASTCRQEISSSVTKQQKIDVTEAKTFCRDNEIIKGAGSLGILSSLCQLATGVLLYFRKLKIAYFLLVPTCLLSFVGCILPFGMRDVPDEDTEEMCNLAVENALTNLSFPYGLYVCWKGGYHNFHNMTELLRSRNAENRNMFLSASAFIICYLICLVEAAAAGALLFFYSRSNPTAKINKVSPVSSYLTEVETIASQVSASEAVQTEPWKSESAKRVTFT